MTNGLIFKSSRDAFDYACRSMARPLVQRANLIGYVENIATKAPGDSSRDPRGKFVVSLATSAGTFQTRFCGSIAAEVSGRQAVAGDLVSVTAASYNAEKEEPLNYFLIAVILQPRLSATSHEFEELLQPSPHVGS